MLSWEGLGKGVFFQVCTATGEQVDLGPVNPIYPVAGYPRQLDTEALVCTCAH